MTTPKYVVRIAMQDNSLLDDVVEVIVHGENRRHIQRAANCALGAALAILDEDVDA